MDTLFPPTDGVARGEEVSADDVLDTLVQAVTSMKSFFVLRGSGWRGQRFSNRPLSRADVRPEIRACVGTEHHRRAQQLSAEPVSMSCNTMAGPAAIFASARAVVLISQRHLCKVVGRERAGPISTAEAMQLNNVNLSRASPQDAEVTAQRVYR